MVNMRQKTYRELAGLIEGKNDPRNIKKKSPLKKTKQSKVIRYNEVKKNGQKKVICAKCNRIRHESKDCYGKTKVAGRDPLSRILRSGLRKK